ncbi:circumsporozoite protein-like [Anastrepha ludens]|uniref:circumsporozoite protein-like n=1 Tax=Anastrepha ludens TaxID=28586 RepID=UPI0023B07E31|nr:circumsporozoite protein-like [Anastrepha ludens]
MAVKYFLCVVAITWATFSFAVADSSDLIARRPKFFHNFIIQKLSELGMNPLFGGISGIRPTAQPPLVVILLSPNKVEPSQAPTASNPQSVPQTNAEAGNGNPPEVGNGNLPEVGNGNLPEVGNGNPPEAGNKNPPANGGGSEQGNGNGNTAGDITGNAPEEAQVVSEAAMVEEMEDLMA